MKKVFLFLVLVVGLTLTGCGGGGGGEDESGGGECAPDFGRASLLTMSSVNNDTPDFSSTYTSGTSDLSDCITIAVAVDEPGSIKISGIRVNLGLSSPLDRLNQASRTQLFDVYDRFGNLIDTNIIVYDEYLNDGTYYFHTKEYVEPYSGLGVGFAIEKGSTSPQDSNTDGVSNGDTSNNDGQNQNNQTTVTVQGVINDTLGTAMANVSLSSEGTAIDTTDSRGSFSLELSPGEAKTLEFSHSQCESQTQSLGPYSSDKTIDIVMNDCFIESESSVIYDSGTGLYWQGYDNERSNWYEVNGVYDAQYNPNSTSICGNLTLGGYSDWRVSEFDELDDIYQTYLHSSDDAPYSILGLSGDYYSTDEYICGGTSTCATYLPFGVYGNTPYGKNYNRLSRCVR